MQSIFLKFMFKHRLSYSAVISFAFDERRSKFISTLECNKFVLRSDHVTGFQ